jgi:hypothetical protein
VLTKNSYLEFLQCPREFWLNFHSPAADKPEPTLHQEHLMQQGFEVLQLAKKMSIFSGEKSGLVEFHRIFSTDYLTTSADITVTDRQTGELQIYEVKSSAKVKPEHIDDIAFQKLAAEMLGHTVTKAFLITVNTAYTRNGWIEPDQLLKIEDVTEQTAAKHAETLANTQEALQYLAAVPEPELKLHCSQQLDCGFIRHHFQHIPVYNVTHINRITAQKCVELVSRNIIDIRHVPDDFQLTEKQRKQVEAARASEPLIDAEAIRTEFASLKYPLNFLDYESFSHAVPKFHNTRPYQQMVFQYSLHTIAEPGAEATHNFCLSKNDGQHPPQEIAESLHAHLENNLGSTIVWNAGFEKTRNRELAEMFPGLDDQRFQKKQSGACQRGIQADGWICQTRRAA